MNDTRRLTVLTSLLASISSTAMAEATIKQFDNVVVTASRTAQTVDDTLAPVTVITREQIERSQSQNVIELLRLAPGLQITDNGGHGASASMFMRGSNSNHTLVLIDGVRINDATGGMAAIPYLDPDQIERIEIVRGPKSSLYGADAIGGVVQIFTRKGAGEPRLTIKAGSGSRGTANSDINLGGMLGSTRVNTNISFFDTNGVDRTTDVELPNDQDAFQNKSASINLSHAFEGGANVGFSAVHNQGYSEYDGYNAPFAETEFSNTVFSTHFNLPILEQWDTRFEAGYSMDENREYITDVNTGARSANGTFDTNRLTLAWLNDIAWYDSQLLTAGIDYYYDDVNDGKDYIEPSSGQKIDSRDNKSIFLQNQSSFDWSDVTVGARLDDNEAYGLHVTGNVAWGIKLPQSMMLIASYGTAYRAPTMSELYSPNTASTTYRSNANLKPEESESVELELKGHWDAAYWSMSIFQNAIDNLIANKKIGSITVNGVENDLFEKHNIAEARIRGIELSVAGQLYGFDVVSSLTFTDAQDLTNKEVLLKRAPQTFMLNVDRTFGRFAVGADFRAMSETTHWGGDKAPGFGVLDLRASVEILPALHIEGKVVNVMNKHYETTLGYNPEPRGFFATVSWSPTL